MISLIEAYAEMVNLTEEQLDEIIGALATAAKGMMAGAKAAGAAAKPLATSAAKYGKSLGKVDAIAKAKPKVSPGQLSLDLKGKGGMKPDTPSSVATGGMSPRRSDTKSGNLVGDEIKRQATATVVNKAVSGGGGGQKERAKNISASADLFDIVKGQLLDEGLSEEEIKNIMLTLTPDEILKEIEESSMSDGSAGGAYQDLGPGGFRSKEQINRMHNDPKGTEKYGKKIMKRVGQAVRDTGTPTVRKVDESKK